MIEVLKVISEKLESAGINYALMEWTGEVQYPYFVGEYAEEEPRTEDGKMESEIILTGFSRKTWFELEMAREKIKQLFPPTNGSVDTVIETQNCVVIYYMRAFPVRSGEEELKKIEIRLKVKKWSVE